MTAAAPEIYIYIVGTNNNEAGDEGVCCVVLQWR